MVQERETGTTEVLTTSAKTTDPSEGNDILVVNVDRTAYLTSVVLANDGQGRQEIVIRNEDGSNPTTVRNYAVPANDTIIDDGEVTNPLVKVPAGKEMAIVSGDAPTGEVSASITLQELAN